MAALIGQIEVFKEDEDFNSYAERLDNFFKANDISDDRKVAVFLSVIRAHAYNLLRSLTVPDKPNTKTYTALIELLKDHYSPKPIVIAERFRFYKKKPTSRRESS